MLPPERCSKGFWTLQEDAAEGARVAAEFQEWSTYWQRNEEVQGSETPWKLKSLKRAKKQPCRFLKWRYEGSNRRL